MTIKELVTKCANSGSGYVRVINENNENDNLIFASISDVSDSLLNSEVIYWEFIHKRQLDAVRTEFILEITV